MSDDQPAPVDEIKPKKLAVTLYADDVALCGDNAPQLQNVEDVLRYFATVHERFGNTCVTINASWGGSSLHAQDRLTNSHARLQQENERLAAKLELARDGMYEIYTNRLEPEVTEIYGKAVREMMANRFDIAGDFDPQPVPVDEADVVSKNLLMALEKSDSVFAFVVDGVIFRPYHFKVLAASHFHLRQESSRLDKQVGRLSQEIDRLNAELLKRNRALEHYADKDVWRSLDETPEIQDWYVGSLNGNGYDVAAATLDGIEKEK